MSNRAMMSPQEAYDRGYKEGTAKYIDYLKNIPMNAPTIKIENGDKLLVEEIGKLQSKLEAVEEEKNKLMQILEDATNSDDPWDLIYKRLDKHTEGK